MTASAFAVAVAVERKLIFRLCGEWGEMMIGTLEYYFRQVRFVGERIPLWFWSDGRDGLF